MRRSNQSAQGRISIVLLVVGLLVGVGIGFIAFRSPAPGIDIPTTPIDIPTTPEPIIAETVPNSAFGPEIDQTKGYLVEEISDGLYWLTEGTYQVMFLTTGEGVIVVDAPPSIGENILNGIREVTSEPITHVIYSHSHADHIAGAGLYPSDATYIAQEEAASLIERANNPTRQLPFGVFVGGSTVPLPTLTFRDELTLEVGSQTLELSYDGPVHAPGNIFIYAPQQRVLMVVDVVFPGWSPFLDLAVSSDVPSFVGAHDRILEFDFETYIGGHLTRLGTRVDVETQREYILDMQNNGAQALQTVDFFAVAGEVGFANQWLLIGTYFERLEGECTSLTLEKWSGRLGGVDLFTPGHCTRLIESLRLD